MEVDLDHYVVLGLPSGEEGAKLSEKEISKAYRVKALELHPDKRPDDPNAHDNFQKLKTSYEILKDGKARKLFDDLLRVRKEKSQRQSFQDSKRRKMMSDLEERERAAYVVDPHRKPQGEEEQIARKLKDEIARIREMYRRQTTSPSPMPKEEASRSSKDNAENGIKRDDKEKMLKVSWEKVGDYTAQRLREIFSDFGVVEDVVIQTSKKKKVELSKGLVVMASKDAAVAATKKALGDLSSPLLVLPLGEVQATKFPSFSDSFSDSRGDVDADEPQVSEFVGAGYQKYEESVLDKMMKKAAEKRSG